MDEYIKREAVRALFNGAGSLGKTVNSIVDSIPTADVVEVRHGEWEVRGQDVCCSVCGGESAYNPFGASKFSIYCPNCGAKMDGKGDGE